MPVMMKSDRNKYTLHPILTNLQSKKVSAMGHMKEDQRILIAHDLIKNDACVLESALCMCASRACVHVLPPVEI